VYVNPGDVAATTGKDGRFEIRSVDGAKRWLLLVWDPFRPGKQGAKLTADLVHENVIHLWKQLQISEPADGAFVVGSSVRVRWEPLPGAARYTVRVDDGARSTPPVVHNTTGQEATITIRPGRYYMLTLQALDASGVVIGEDCVPSCTVFQLSVAGPKAEAQAQPVPATLCKIGERASPADLGGPSDPPSPSPVAQLSRS
jgi:hypothetical protein